MQHIFSDAGHNKLLMILSESSEIEVMKILYNNNIIFGAYKWMEVDKMDNAKMQNKLKSLYPNAKVLVFINIIPDFAKGVK